MEPKVYFLRTSTPEEIARYEEEHGKEPGSTHAWFGFLDELGELPPTDIPWPSDRPYIKHMIYGLSDGHVAEYLSKLEGEYDVGTSADSLAAWIERYLKDEFPEWDVNVPNHVGNHGSKLTMSPRDAQIYDRAYEIINDLWSRTEKWAYEKGWDDDLD